MTIKEKNRNFSISAPVEMHEELKDAANRLGHGKISVVVQKLIKNYLPFMLDENSIPVIIAIPKELLSDPESLKVWLAQKSTAIHASVTKR